MISIFPSYSEALASDLPYIKNKSFLASTYIVICSMYVPAPYCVTRIHGVYRLFLLVVAEVDIVVLTYILCIHI